MHRRLSPLPVRITLVLWLVLISTAWNAFRVWGGLEFRGGIEKYASWPGPTYVILTGGLWVACGLAILAAFLRRERWAGKALLVGAMVYVAWLWVDRLAIQPKLPANWPFSLVTNSVLLVITAAVALDPRNRYYLGREAHEREEQDRKTA
jgi:hypothetical protein